MCFAFCQVFRPYARFWLAPLVQLVTRGELGGDGINYFITDLVVTLLSWHTTAIPEVSYTGIPQPPRGGKLYRHTAAIPEVS